MGEFQLFFDGISFVNRHLLSLSMRQEQMHEHLDDHLSESKVPEDARPRAPRLLLKAKELWPLGGTFEEHL